MNEICHLPKENTKSKSCSTSILFSMKETVPLPLSFNNTGYSKADKTMFDTESFRSLEPIFTREPF